MKRMIKTLLVIFLAFTSIVFVNAEAPKEINNYYYDEMEVLSPETKELIVEKNKYLEDKYGAQIVVATIKDLGVYDSFN